MFCEMKSRFSGKKIFLTGLIIMWSVCVALYAAGLRFGMTGAVKQKVKELDEKVKNINPSASASTQTIVTSDLVWKYATDPINDSSPAIASDGTVYVGSQPSEHRYEIDKGNFYALSSTGSLKWKMELGKYKCTIGAPAVGSDGAVYFVVGTVNPLEDLEFLDIKLYAVTDNGSSYTQKWIYEIYSTTRTDKTYSTWQSNEPAIGSDGTIYVSGYNNFHALLPTGTTKWILLFNPNPDGHQPGYVSCPSIGSDGTIYLNVEDNVLVSTNGGHAGIYAIDPSTGGTKWRYVHDDFGKDYELSAAAPSIASDGTIYAARGSQEVGTTNSYIYAVNSAGSFKWRFYTLGRFISATPSIGADGTLYVGTTAKNHVPAPSGDPDSYSAGMFFAINPDGTEKWRYDTSIDMEDDRDIYATAAVGDDGLIYFATELKYIYVMNPDGSVNKKINLYEFDADGKSGVITHSSFAISNGALYVGLLYNNYVEASTPENVVHKGALIAVKIDSTGYASSPWPKFRNNNGNTGHY